MSETMETVVLGGTGRRVSRLGFGGAVAGIPNYLRPYNPENPSDRERVLAAVRRAVELGVNYFDTAPGYGDGASERLLGEGLEGVPAERLFLAGKVGVWQETDVRESVEASLERLRRQRLDLLQLHGTAYTAEQARRVLKPGGMLDQMQRLKDEGLVAHLGFTAEALNRPFYDIFDSGRFEVLQILYNVANQQACDFAWKSGPVFEAEARGMGIVAMRSTTAGLLQKWMAAAQPGTAFDCTEAAIRFQFSNPMVDVVLLGMDSVEVVEKNAALCADRDGRFDLESFFQRRS